MKNKYVIILINILIYTYTCVTVYGKTDHKSFVLEKFTTLNGLSDNHINDLVKDKFGIIWLATDFGVTRYDGVNFNKIDDVVFPKQFRNKKVLAIIPYLNQLLFHVKDAGIISYHPLTNSINIITELPVLKTHIIGSYVYYFGDNGFLYLHSDSTKRKAFFIGKLSYFEFNHYQDGLYFLIRNRGFIKFNINTKKIQLNVSNKVLFQDIGFPIKSSSNLFLMNNKLYKIRGNGTIIQSQQQVIDENITYFGYDLQQQPLYIVKTKTIFSKSFDFNTLINRYQLQDHELRKIIQVNPSTYFVLTNQGLLKFSIKKLISHKIALSKISNPNDIQVRRRIIPISSNEVVYLGYPGIIHIKGTERTFINYENKPLPCYDGIKIGQSIFIVSEGVGVFNYELKTQQLTKLLTSSITPFSNFDAITNYHNQLLLVSHDKIVLYNPETNRENIVLFSEKQAPFCVKYDAFREQVLIGTKDKLLIYNVKDKNFKLERTVPSDNFEIRDIHISKDNQSLYFATNSGFYRLNRKNYVPIFHYADNENKSNNLVCTVNEAANGSIWLTTFSGVIRYNCLTNKVTSLNQKNGLHNIEYNYNASAWLNNDLFVGGLNNYEVIHTALLNTQKRHYQLFLSSYSINSFTENSRFFCSPNNTVQSIIYRTDNQDLALQFSSNYLAESDHLTYKYKLDKGQWKSMENATIRFAYLPYGSYELTVVLIDQFGTQIAQKKLVIQAAIPFYKKQGFFLFLMLIILLFSLFIIFLIIQRNRVVEATKKRIAMDLHDEAGTILTRTLLFVRMNNQTEKTPFTNKIEANVQELLFSIRAFMSSLSTNKSTSYQLGDELQEFFFKNSQESERVFLFTNLIQQEIVISNELYRDIKLCVFEITNNFLKHSNGEKLSVFLQLKEKKIILLFEDSGNNFDPSTSNAGNGLRNIKKRTERNKGVFKIDKNLENSIISITFPI
jgi:ligand-binding sensor domain-containing protein/anti-sigma regulatory factor (Ser/Thr protein kinase)